MIPVGAMLLYDLSLVAMVGFVCWKLHSPWPLIGLIFMMVPK